MKTIIPIGIATIEYNQEGEPKKANFKPLLELKAANVFLKQLMKVKPESKEVLKNNAGLVMASWFSKLTEVELADREKYHITSRVIRCTKHSNNAVRRCSLGFQLEEI